ncbi:shikimate kinase [Mucilaginibacter sp.]|uniref:shikimate kinase n=1 Tax=Mucilaginibacter sp. TaxID=1882438 RepID=UPI000CC2A99A|nr:shikimate kinase [Mucilaginibacter sp.]PLW91584.1 MAG: shikimate kinase [Mucilaginibacter sp.]HEK20760.1 shikimate kinase [Bacteroidota bacterium]
MSLIFLVGFMGCGKTTMGRKLSNALGYEFVDLDHQFEENAGISIAEYFSKNGEDAFREQESKILKETHYPQNAVISTGGGLPCFFDNMDWMNANGQTVYMKLTPKMLASRLENAKTPRPVLQGRKGQDLVDFIESKLAEREPHYSKASIVAESFADLTPENIMYLLATNK